MPVQQSALALVLIIIEASLYLNLHSLEVEEVACKPVEELLGA